MCMRRFLSFLLDSRVVDVDSLRLSTAVHKHRFRDSGPVFTPVIERVSTHAGENVQKLKPRICAEKFEPAPEVFSKFRSSP